MQGSFADSLAAEVQAAIARAFTAAGFSGAIPETITLERPKNRDHGDYSTSIALQLAKAADKNPRDVATVLQKEIAQIAGISRVDIAGPGFINITVDRGTQAELVQHILTSGESYGRGNSLTGTAINLEFISANPTGPLHLGHTRWAAVGDALGRVLSAAGAQVTREFYINDRGRQMDLFGESVRAAARGEAVPEDGYQGEYIRDLAQAVLAAQPQASSVVEFREAAYQLQLAEQKSVLHEFHTNFDIWFSERSLHDSKAVEHALEKLRSQGHVFEEEGAVWLRTTDFGDDKDRVIVKADGDLTYFASDSAYYINKRERGFDICIYMLEIGRAHV